MSQEESSDPRAAYVAKLSAAPLRVALVTNIPAPYRLPVYELLARTPGIELLVVFCSGRESNRAWNLGAFKFAHLMLRERVLRWRGRFIHTNPDVWPALRAFRPDVVVTTGFNPTHLLAFAYASVRGLRHIAMTDGTNQSELGLSALHRRIRRWVYARSAAFVGASEGSFALYRGYGLANESMFKSHLCARNESFKVMPLAEREFDFIFCGRFVAGKLPLFALQVAADTAGRIGRRVRMLFVGSGELDMQVRHEASAAAAQVQATFAGFARQEELPAHYGCARVLLFPTITDTWGVVANEACAAGLPVIVSPSAGVAEELVRDGENGHVLPLDRTQWVEAATSLLLDAKKWARMSARSVELVRPYTYRNAAIGLAAAIRHASGRPRGQLSPDVLPLVSATLGRQPARAAEHAG